MDTNMFCSPPKVRRTICLTPSKQVIESQAQTQNTPSSSSSSPWTGRGTNEFVQNSVSMEGAMVEQAVDTLLSLPEVVGQVSVIQKGQHMEVQKQLELMEKLKNGIRIGKEKCNDVMQEISRVERNTRNAVEEVEEKAKTCKTYKKEIESLVTVCETLRHQLRIKQAEVKDRKHKCESYRSKMETHKVKVADYERTKPAQKKLLDLQERLSSLENKKQGLCEDMAEYRAVCEGDKEEERKKEAELLRERLQQLEGDGVARDKQLADLREQENKIELSITVLHKRNAAQVTRLKRQVREHQLRHRQWQDQLTQLQLSVAELRGKLEE